jgi:hypothetical protein
MGKSSKQRTAGTLGEFSIQHPGFIFDALALLMRI